MNAPTPPFAPSRPFPRSTSGMAATAPAYPATFVIPDRQPYSYSVDMGIIRSEMAAGNARQRRAFTNMPHALSLSFHMRIEELWYWQNWVNTYAYSWFLCPVSTMYAGGPPAPSNLRYEVLRFTSDLQVAMDGWDWVAVTVAAELSANAESHIDFGDWIIGGTPAAPNSDLWHIGGTPADPSPEWALAGTPARPSSLV